MSNNKKAINKRWREANPDAFKDYYKGKEQLFKARSVEQRKRNTSFVKEFKDQKACVDCKNIYPHYVLQFDHVRGDKVEDVSKMAGKGTSLKTIREEIDKCELVCANCHATRTFMRRQKMGQ